MSTIVPRQIYDPATGSILGGALSARPTPTVAPVENPPMPFAAQYRAPLEVRPTTGGFLSGVGTSGIPGVPFAGAPGSLFAPVLTAVTEPSSIAGTGFGGASVMMEPMAGPGFQAITGGVSARGIMSSLVPISVGGRALALPAVERVVARAIVVAGGAALVRRVYDAYVAFRRAGHGHHRARRMAHNAAGFVFKRRRMRATNVKALRRAIRRVRSFKRIARKVGALGVSSHGRPRFTHPRHRRMRRYYRRGDIPVEGDIPDFVVEDTADVYDEAEDLGYLDDDQDDVSEAAGE